MSKIPKATGLIFVDDDNLDRKLYERLLERTEFTDGAMMFPYAQQALDYLKLPDRDVVNVIFLDINLPRMTGVEFLNAAIEQLGSAMDEISVFFLTTSTNPADRKLVDDFDCVKGYLNKPLAIEHLQEVARIVSATDTD